MTDHPDKPDDGMRRADPVRRAREELFLAERGLRNGPAEASHGEDNLGKLLEILKQINAELDVERVLHAAAQAIMEIFEAERVFILEIEPNEQIRFRVATSFTGRPIADPETEVSHAVIREVARKREPILVADATKDPRFALVSSVQHLQLHSVMAAPLLALGDLLGVVCVDNRVLSGAFNRHTLDLLGVFANHVGIALRNARLFHELDATRKELALAERLKTIGEIAAFVVHEVKNHLAPINFFVKTLRERWAEPDVRAKAFAVIPEAVSRLNRAVSQILEYARPTPLIKVPLDLARLVQAATRALGPELESEQVEVTTDFEPGLPAVLADGERLREVFVNLIKNAMEAMAESQHKELRISVRRPDETREEAVFEDTGTGIPEADIEGVFEPFRSHKQSGTGMGLAFCQKIVREHGGDIEAENVPGGGARFRLRLPVTGS